VAELLKAHAPQPHHAQGVWPGSGVIDLNHSTASDSVAARVPIRIRLGGIKAKHHQHWDSTAGAQLLARSAFSHYRRLVGTSNLLQSILVASAPLSNRHKQNSRRIPGGGGGQSTPWPPP
jgi:hypothetical protein